MRLAISPAILALGIVFPMAVLAEGNLVRNGGFERPVVIDHQLFSTIPAWTSGACGIEVQRIFTAPGKGQYAELDTNCPSSISQVLQTTPNTPYTLCANYSPRPGNGDNRISVWWAGQSLGMLSKDGSDLVDTAWRRHCMTGLIATTDATTLEFIDESVPDGFGGFLDDVSVTPSP